MKISSNNIPNIINKKSSVNSSDSSNQKTQSFSASLLPANNVNGISAINSSTPMPYTKIGEIELPNFKDKASVFKLANGQKIIIQPQKGSTIINTTYNVGGFNEPIDYEGISHFIEHNLFNGSKNLAPKEYDKHVYNMGAETNASTGYNATNYYIRFQLLNDNSLEEAIKLNALQTQYPTFPIEQLEKEKEPVKSEIDVYKDLPLNCANSIVLKNLYNLPFQGENLIIGSKNNINSFSREQVLDYFNTWYTPDNAVTVINGDVDVDETIKLVSKYFNKKSDYSHINKRQSISLKPINHPIRADIISPNSESANISLGFPIDPNISNVEEDNLNLLIDLISSKNSNLSQLLKYIGLNDNFSITMENLENKPNSAKILYLNCTMPEYMVEPVLNLFYEELNKLSCIPPSDSELNNVKQNKLSDFHTIATSDFATNNILTQIGMKNDYNLLNNTISNVISTTPLDISQTAKKFFDFNKISICVAHSKSASAQEIQNNYSELHKSNVSFGRSNPLNSICEEINKCKQFKLPNNIQTTITDAMPFDKSVINLNIKSDQLDSYSKPALLILAQMLTDTHSQNVFNMTANNSSTNNIEFFANNKGINIETQFYDDNLTNTIRILKETLLNPNFSQDKFNKIKENVKNNIQTSDPSPYNKIYEEIFDNINYYGSKEQYLQEIDNLTLNDIKSLYSHLLSSCYVSSTLTAPISQKPYLQDIFNNELSSFPMFNPYNISQKDTYTPIKTPKTFTIANENNQANIVQAYKYKNSSNIQDAVKILLLNNILGNGMSSRLFTDLREHQKLAYSVGSSINKSYNTGAFLLFINTTTDSPDPKEGSPENAIKALDGFNNNVNRLKTELVSKEELDRAKNLLKTDILNSYNNNLNINESINLATQNAYGLNLDKLMFEYIDQVNEEDIKSAANFVFANPPITSIVASQKTLDFLQNKNEGLT